MDMDDIDEAAAHTRKAGSTVSETRDSPHPKFITELLITILAATDPSSAIQDPIRRVTKRIADDVLWKKTFGPWRRSKLWLVIRVALQTTLEPHEYKAFMAFALAGMLQRALSINCDNDMIRCMAVKCSRKGAKLLHVHGGPIFVQERITAACRDSDRKLELRWNKTLQDIEPHLSGWDPKRLDFQKDTELQLQNSRPVIMNILSGKHSTSLGSTFHHPKHSPRLKVKTLDSMFQKLSFGSDNARYINLIDFENAVRSGLGRWTADNLRKPNAQSVLLSAIRSYYSAANVEYKDNAENQSIMVLTILVLWRSIDKIAVSQCGMLAEFPCEVPPDMLEHLLLSHRGDLERVQELSIYLTQRHQNVKWHRNSLFEPTSTSISFSVRYFNTSTPMQNALASITQKGQRDRAAKEAEYEQSYNKWRDLTERASRLTHDHRKTQVWLKKQKRYNIQKDKSHCEPCKLLKQVGFFISVHSTRTHLYRLG